MVIVLSFLIAGCGNYKPSSTDVVETHGKITNYSKFKEFLEDVTNGKNGEVRVVSYTNEGDPILHDLKYNGKNIKSTLDTTRDEFGEQKVDVTTCEAIKKNKEDNKIEYQLSGCKNTKRMNIILTVRQ
ncbi:DUF4362 domain-containing protein [Bacillus sp. JJ1764]|uniref:DUF4362 domain-containing protein n=1 Tax=Bacillus sp. JJ1764 TaxID=3122964 RepID=UPI003000C345